jgi:hypothetical protein
LHGLASYVARGTTYAVTFVYGGHKETNTKNQSLERLMFKLTQSNFGFFDRNGLTEAVACCAFCFGGWNYPTSRDMPHLEAAIEKIRSALKGDARTLKSNWPAELGARG